MSCEDNYENLRSLKEYNPNAYRRYLRLEKIRRKKDAKANRLEKFMDSDGINSRGMKRISEYDFIQRVCEENCIVGNGLKAAYRIKNFIVDSFEVGLTSLGESRFYFRE